MNDIGSARLCPLFNSLYTVMSSKSARRSYKVPNAHPRSRLPVVVNFTAVWHHYAMHVHLYLKPCSHFDDIMAVHKWVTLNIK